MTVNNHNELFAGLKALAESAFPKHCRSCGRTFATAEAFMRETSQISEDRTGLKQCKDEHDITIVEVYRNCPCGSTLMDFFSDRRDRSEVGAKRRDKFEKLVAQLVAYGWTRDVARIELLKILRGERSEMIEALKSLQRSNARR